jgi:hypothetical protein
VFLIALRARRVDQDAAHQPRRHGQEVGAILPVDPLDIDQTQVCLVNEGGRLEAVPCLLPSHASPCNAVQFVVDERDQLVQRRLVSAAPCEQQPGDVGGLWNALILAGFPAMTVPEIHSRLLDRGGTGHGEDDVQPVGVCGGGGGSGGFGACGRLPCQDG